MSAVGRKRTLGMSAIYPKLTFSQHHEQTPAEAGVLPFFEHATRHCEHERRKLCSFNGHLFTPKPEKVRKSCGFMRGILD